MYLTKSTSDTFVSKYYLIEHPLVLINEQHLHDVNRHFNIVLILFLDVHSYPKTKQ